MKSSARKLLNRPYTQLDNLSNRQSRLTKSAFDSQRKSALKVINAAVTGHTWGLKKSNGLDYSNNLSGDFSPIKINPSDKEIWFEKHTTRDVQSGDFLYIPKFTQYGVGLATDIIDGRKVWWCLLSSGAIVAYPEQAVVYSAPLFKQGELKLTELFRAVEQIKKNPLAQHHIYNPENDSYALLKSKLVSRFKRMLFDVESTLRQYTLDFSKVFEKIRDKSDTKWREYDIITLLQREFKIHNPSRLQIMAFHMMLYRNTTEYNMIDNQAAIKEMRFSVRPKVEVEILRLVNEWMNTKEGREILISFVEKSRGLLKLSDSISKETGVMPKAITDIPSTLKYDERENIIIRLITDSCQTLNTPAFNPYESVVCVLLKNFDKYHHVNQENWRSLSFDFLQTIGLFAPWETIHMAGSTSVVPRDNDPDSRFKLLGDIAMKEHNSNGSTSLHVNDLLENHRRDFSKLPVYVIDDAGANELDDGMSVEPTDKDGNTWVHVHIADPTSVIPFNHPLSILAKERHTSVYLPHRTIPMLPKEFCMSNFSLGSRSPQQALTFSAQLDDKGRIRNYDVSPSFINNIKIMQYNAVDEVLGADALQNDNRLLDKSPNKASNTSISTEDIDTLGRVSQLAVLHSTRRVENGMLFWHTFTPEAQVTPLPLPTPPSELALWDGRPSVKLLAVPNVQQSPARFAVSQFMSIACEVTALWCRDHDVPGIFRGAGLPEVNDPSSLEDLMGKRDIVTGVVSSADVGKSMASFSGSTLSTKPIPHLLNGCPDGYARVTSPLRRYNDMVSHYQIKSAILSIRQPRDKISWMYPTHDSLAQYLIRTKQNDSIYQRLSNNVNAYWVVRELKKRYESNPSLFKDLRCTLISAWKNDGALTRSFADCEIAQLGGMKARIYKEKSVSLEESFKDIGNVVSASIADFQLYEKSRIIVKMEL
ncbi:hypothetical protein E3Q23_02774 [Wallemia mellicola]|uniref:RNB-domain-containing protein n=1 Tax=Wallemia mellicola TaxID=1708541 RepID=A0A4T0LVX2_9BASI|nr:hypothetical protein E3Q23_02774 [Wallemia mellicola]TIC09359.1 RNB-domain-containing protein [Wallemia mellicola]TIC51265.1 RNB-domain-containing protein [Wallemia mellicola]TIC64053.1 RNB-domain-containing protein [Wallemia mellicola]